MNKQTQYEVVSALSGLTEANPVLKAIIAICRDEENMVAADCGDPAVVGEPLHKLAGQLNGVRRVWERIEEYRTMLPADLESED